MLHAHACLQSETIGQCDAQVEAKTNHDVKAIEYVIKDRISHNAELAKVRQYCTWLCTVGVYVFVSAQNAALAFASVDVYLLPSAQSYH